MKAIKMNLSQVENYMEQQGLESFGEAGFGKKYMDELARLGVTEKDEIEIFENDWRGIVSEDTGNGRANGRTFAEDGNSNTLRLVWLDETHENVFDTI